MFNSQANGWVCGGGVKECILIWGKALFSKKRQSILDKCIKSFVKPLILMKHCSSNKKRINLHKFVFNGKEEEYETTDDNTYEDTNKMNNQRSRMPDVNIKNSVDNFRHFSISHILFS